MLTERLKKIVQYIDQNSIVADIGTDHGKIPLYLSENDISKRIIATDISEKSLNKLEEQLERYYHINNIELRVMDGLTKVLPFEVDTIVISGMGGILISEILKQGIKTATAANKLILQANNSREYLRYFLHQEGFQILEEDDLFENNKYYQIIVAQPGLEQYETKVDYKYGKKLIDKKSNDLGIYIGRKKKEISAIIDSIQDLNTEASEQRILELKAKKALMEEVERRLEN